MKENPRRRQRHSDQPHRTRRRISQPTVDEGINTYNRVLSKLEPINAYNRLLSGLSPQKTTLPFPNPSQRPTAVTKTSHQRESRVSKRKHHRPSPPHLISERPSKHHKSSTKPHAQRTYREPTPRSDLYKPSSRNNLSTAPNRSNRRLFSTQPGFQIDLTSSPSTRPRPRARHDLIAPQPDRFFGDIQKFLAPELKFEMAADPVSVDHSLPEFRFPQSDQQHRKPLAKREASPDKTWNEVRPTKSARLVDKAAKQVELVEISSDSEVENGYMAFDRRPPNGLPALSHAANKSHLLATARNYGQHSTRELHELHGSPHARRPLLDERTEQLKWGSTSVQPHQRVRSANNYTEQSFNQAKVDAKLNGHNAWESDDEGVEEQDHTNLELPARDSTSRSASTGDEEMTDARSTTESNESGSEDEDTHSSAEEASLPSTVKAGKRDQHKTVAVPGHISNVRTLNGNRHTASKNIFAVDNVGSEAGTTIEEAFQRQRMQQSQRGVIPPVYKSNVFQTGLVNSRTAQPASANILVEKGDSQRPYARRDSTIFVNPDDSVSNRYASSQASTDIQASHGPKLIPRTKEREHWEPGRIAAFLDHAKKLRAKKEQEEAKQLQAQKAAKEAEEKARRADREKQKEAQRQGRLLKGNGRGRKANGTNEGFDDEDLNLSEESDDVLREQKKAIKALRASGKNKKPTMAGTKNAANANNLDDLRKQEEAARKQQEAVAAAIEAEEEKIARKKAKEDRMAERAKAAERREAEKVERAKAAEQREAERKRAREEKIKQDEEERVKRKRENEEFVANLIKLKEAERAQLEQQVHASNVAELAASDAELERIKWQHGGYKVLEEQRRAQLQPQANQKLTDLQAWRNDTAQLARNGGEKASVPNPDPDVDMAWMDMEEALNAMAAQKEGNSVNIPSTVPGGQHQQAQIQSPQSGLFVPDPSAPPPPNPFRGLSSLGAPSVVSQLGSVASKCGSCRADHRCPKHREEGQCPCRPTRPCALHKEEPRCPCRSDYTCTAHRQAAEGALLVRPQDAVAAPATSNPSAEPSTKAATNDMDLDPATNPSDPAKDVDIEPAMDPATVSRMEKSATAVVPEQRDSQQTAVTIDLTTVRNVRPKLKEEDQLLYDLRQGGLDWEAVCGAWRLKIGKDVTDDSLKKRYQNARKTLGLEPEARTTNEQKPNPIKKMLLKTRRGMANSGVPQFYINTATGEGTSTNAEPRPTFGGKSYNEEAIKAYLSSMEEEDAVAEQHEDELVQEEADEPRRYVREPSPITGEDCLYWGYQVLRRTWPAEEEPRDDDDGDDPRFPWYLCGGGQTFSVLAEANHAATEELRQERQGFEIWGQESFSLTTNHQEGRVFHLASSPNAKTMVKVSRVLHTPVMGKLPKSKVGWLGRKCYLVWKKTTTVTIVDMVDGEGKGPGIDEPRDLDGNQESMDGVERSESANRLEDGDKDADGSMEEWNDIDHLFEDHMDLTGNQNTGEQLAEPATDVANGNTEEGTQKLAVQPPKQPETITEKTIMIGGVYTILDMANRDAARLYIDMAAPKSTRIDACMKRKETEEEVEADVQRLEQSNEGFKVALEIEDEATEIVIWVETRDLVGPRNI